MFPLIVHSHFNAQPLPTVPIVNSTDAGPQAMVENEEAALKETKRLQHNARVTFDRRIKSS